MSEQIKTLFSRPALIIIFIMVMINAGVVLYVYKNDQSNDQAQQETIDRTQQVSKQNRFLLVKLDQETEERRDVNCKGYESQHLQEVRDLERTYRILEDPPAVYKELLQNPIVLEGLKETVKAAQDDTDEFGVFVSPFCDDPGVGLAEPDPKIPEPPEGYGL